AAALILVGVVAAAYYSEHFAAVATVDGTGISRDQWIQRQAVDRYRLGLLEEQIRSALAAGQLDRTTAQEELQSVQQQVGAIPSNSLEELIDASLQQRLATKEGITVTRAEVDQQLTAEATTPEQRKVLAIFVAPGESPAAGVAAGASVAAVAGPTAGASLAPSASAVPPPSPTASPVPKTTARPKATTRPKASAAPNSKATTRPSASPRPSATASPSTTAAAPGPGGSLAPGGSAAPAAPGSAAPSGPTAAQQAQAMASADAALAELTAGQAFDQVARQYSTDPSAANGGDIGYVSATDTADPAWVAALFALPLNGTTGVVEGADGSYRIGRVVAIVPAKPGGDWQPGVERAGVSLDAYRAAALAALYRQKLAAWVLASATTGNVDQVHAWEIRIGSGASAGAAITDAEVEASQILYSPGGDPSNASSLLASDPSWAAALKEAQAAVNTLRAIADPAQRAAEFAQFARTQSDDASSATNGGALGWISRATVVKEIADAVFTGTHAADAIIGPVKTQYGYHVLLFVAQRSAPTDPVAAVQQELTVPNANFATIARENSDAADAPRGGDMGWLARWQDPGSVDSILFGLQVGHVSAPVKQPDGTYIYLVGERARRPVDPTQRAILEASAFTNWYSQQKSDATIWRASDDASGSSASQGAAAG
ncbi:MAG TPA: peptidylprolyl isomerase, partial [Candidatus Acidoferrales bacterium]|nr:peptidylprolyl isomerase [Candidatus Acidoferrales bacterium]